MAGYTNPDALVTTAWLADHLEDPSLRIVDVRFSLMGPLPGEYAAGHIPGAVFCNLFTDVCDPDAPVPCHVAGQARFEASMSRLGIANQTHVIAYDQDFGPWAAHLWWALRHYGHDQVSILDGGLGAWKAESRPVDSGAVSVAASSFNAVTRPLLRASLQEVLQAEHADDVIVVDALPGKIYRGEALFFPTHRAGHIPGAHNISAPSNIDRTTGHLLPADELRRVWSRVGLKPGRRVIAYCGAGDYGSFDLFALHLIGHDNAALYDGCWFEWGARQDLPVEVGAETAG